MIERRNSNKNSPVWSFLVDVIFQEKKEPEKVRGQLVMYTMSTGAWAAVVSWIKMNLLRNIKGFPHSCYYNTYKKLRRHHKVVEKRKNIAVYNTGQQTWLILEFQRRRQQARPGQT